MMEDYSLSFVREIEWYNEVILGSLLPVDLWRALPRFCQSWLRNYIAALIVYFVGAGLWTLYSYLNRRAYLSEDSMPKKKFILMHIWVSMKSIPAYVIPSCVSEYMVGKGWTRCYSAVEEVGWPMHIACTILYFGFVDCGVYLVHIAMHEIRPLKRFHTSHHVFNSKQKVSPFAGLATDPVDGMMHSSPSFLGLFVVPTHFFTHFVLLFIQCVWSANIHSNMNAHEPWPIMGPRYHIIHHLKPNYNYGIYTVFPDWLFGTLHDPEPDAAKQK